MVFAAGVYSRVLLQICKIKKIKIYKTKMAGHNNNFSHWAHINAFGQRGHWKSLFLR
jgi:hypothetical protein